ncbi:MAG: acyl-CoA dehydrogenase [Actinobacteria bacterium]|nr:acyl-CoA dehydrogenase [Actinomycetota bacterium]
MSKDKSARNLTDVLALDARLNEEQRALKKMLREFADKELRPKIGEWFESGEIPAREIAREVGSLGILGMHLDGYGCAGSDALSYGLACLELEAVDSGLRSLVSVQGSLSMFAIHEYGSDAQRERWLPGMAKGELIGCFGLTEADFGSNPSGMRTFAKREGSDWVINGSKMWITNGNIADVAIVWANTDEGIRGFAVPTETKGFKANLIKHKLSLRASVSSELVLEDMRIPDEYRLPKATSLRAPLMCLAEARFGIIFGVVGAARDCLESSLAYGATRIQFDRPISAYQLTQSKYAEMASKVTTSLLLAYHLADLKDGGKIEPEQISMGKYHNVQSALEVARSARSILGGAGITTEYPVFRHMSNLETVLTYEGTHEIHTLVIGLALTGENAIKYS